MKQRMLLIIMGIILLLLTGCMDELEYTPRTAEFTSFYPEDETSGIEPYISLYWTCEFAESYNLYLGTSEDSLDVLANNTSITEYTIDELHLNTTYYWQVVAYNGEDVPEYGPILSFSTRNANWGTFYPEDQSANQPVELYLNWGAGRESSAINNNSDIIEDADQRSSRESTTLYYDLYIGFQADSLDLLAEDIEEEFYLLDDLLWSTTYYWQVRVRNELTELTSSSVLTFTTISPTWGNTYPDDQSVRQGISPVLSWELNTAGRDIDDSSKEDVFSYDLYLREGAAGEMELISSGITATSFTLSDLQYQTQYQWQVKAIYNNLQVLESDIYTFTTQNRFMYMYPTGYEPHISSSPTLIWSCIDGVEYDLYFGIDENDLDLIASGLTDTTYTVNGLAWESTYKWQVRAELIDGTYWTSPVAVFFTTIDPIPPGYNMHNKLIRAQMPCNIDVVYRVTDRADRVTDVLSAADFSFLEDGEDIDPIESDLHIYQGNEINSTMRTVLMIDNSTSMDSMLCDIKLAAYEFVERLQFGQEMCVYTFSENPVLVHDFTSHKGSLISAINSIGVGYSSTDLYGAVIEGVDRWADIYYPENLIKGNMILITDGSDTQGSSTLTEALEARGNREIYTMGIGSDIDEEALGALGNGGFFELESAGESIIAFQAVQDEIVHYLDSFYWLHYITPKRGDVEHTISISIAGNHNIGESGRIEGSFNSANFYGTLPGVYVNIDPENGLPYGIEEFTITDSVNYVFEAVTYEPQQEPVYRWQLEDNDIAEILFINGGAHSIVLRAGSQSGSTVLTVTDTANQHVRNINLYYVPAEERNVK